MKLAEFVAWVIREGPWEGVDLCGGDVQDKATECGILTETKYDPEAHGEASCDWIEAGDPYYVFSDVFKAALATERKEP